MALSSYPPVGTKVLHPKLGEGVVTGFKSIGVRTMTCRFGKRIHNIWWSFAAEKMSLK